MNLIEHHNGMIAKAALAQFLNLGQANVGSFALSASQTDLFLMALNGLLQHLCAVTESSGGSGVDPMELRRERPCSAHSRQAAQLRHAAAGGDAGYVDARRAADAGRLDGSVYPREP